MAMKAGAGLRKRWHAEVFMSYLSSRLVLRGREGASRRVKCSSLTAHFKEMEIFWIWSLYLYWLVFFSTCTHTQFGGAVIVVVGMRRTVAKLKR